MDEDSFRLPGFGRSPLDAWHRNWIEWRRHATHILRRSADVLVAITLIVLAAPVLCVLYLGRRRFRIRANDTRYLGCRGHVFVSKELDLGRLSESMVARSGIGRIGLAVNLL